MLGNLTLANISNIGMNVKLVCHQAFDADDKPARIKQLIYQEV